MCTECGCGQPAKTNVSGSEDVNINDHEHEHIDEYGNRYTHSHSNDHAHTHDHSHQEESTKQIVAVHKKIMNANNLKAEHNRGIFQNIDMLAINVLSSPGAGKTTLLKKVIELLNEEKKCGVIVGDLETENDAIRLRETGAPVVQISTGTLCHLDADMVLRSLDKLNLKKLDILFIENVGNLVCPATFDLGEELRIAMLSATEGEDKPLKYPPLFRFADIIILSKIDIADACEFDRELALENIRNINPNAELFELSAKSGEGLSEFCQYLLKFRAKSKEKSFV